ncbi:DinB family protein [Pedobacter sp. ASV28]|uniref:DinB family protein n=1 Tax=Pedobacter sp. ASV28 TaxID=2795123 RepID=UPI0018EB9473|nr:DinB family protein [Pedobacter sp. ASV28]
MKIIEELLKELAYEAEITRKFLKIVPVEKFDWAPHEKSMKMKALATHLAELPSWIGLALNTEGLDFATTPYEPVEIKDHADLLVYLNENVATAKADLEKITEADLDGRWVMRSGETIHADLSKYETIRHSFSQTSHHRAQLGVYLRLLNIPIPGTYGPSADDHSF